MKIFISDLDGTLLDRNARISAETEQILNDLICQGMCFTVASGRTPLSAIPILQGVDISLPLVLMNGALIYDVKQRQCLYSVELGEACVHALENAEERCGVYGMIISIDQGGLRLHVGSDLDRRLWAKYDGLFAAAQASAICPQPQRQTAADLYGSQVLYALYMDDRPERLAGMYRILSRQPGLILDSYQDIYMERCWCLEVTSARTSKRHAVGFLREMCHAACIVGFGDGKNDLPLFDACDVSFAVANACPEAKARADSVIGSNLENGVAIQLKALWEQDKADGGVSAG